MQFCFSLKKVQMDSLEHERRAKEMLNRLEQTEKDLNQRNVQMEAKYLRDQSNLERRLAKAEELARVSEEKCTELSKELQAKQLILLSVEEELLRANETITKDNAEIDSLRNKLTQLEGRSSCRNSFNVDSLTDLTDIDLDVDLDSLGHNDLLEYCFFLKSRFEVAIAEINALKHKLKESNGKCDALELNNFSIEKRLELKIKEAEEQSAFMVTRIDYLTSKLAAAEKQIRTKTKQEAKDKRRCLSLKGMPVFILKYSFHTSYLFDCREGKFLY